MELQENAQASKAIPSARNRMRTSWPHVVILSFMLMNFGQLSTMFMLYIGESHPFVNAAMSYASFIGIWIITLLFMLIFRENRILFKAFATKPFWKQMLLLLLGLAIGLAMNLACAFGAMLHGDIQLSLKAFQPLPLLVLLFCVLIQSGAEELVTRLFLYQKLRQRYNRIVAVLINGLLFGALHLGNPGATPLGIADVTFFGLLASCSVICTDSIWTAIGIHTAWNFCQSILLGLPNSGLTLDYSLYQLDKIPTNTSFFYDAGFGLEGTWCAVLLEILVCAIFLAIILLKKRTDTDIWGEYSLRGKFGKKGETQTDAATNGKRQSALGIAAFCLAMSGWLALPGLIMGIIDLAKNKNDGQLHGLAKAAVIIAPIQMVFLTINLFCGYLILVNADSFRSILEANLQSILGINPLDAVVGIS